MATVIQYRQFQLPANTRSARARIRCARCASPPKHTAQRPTESPLTLRSAAPVFSRSVCKALNQWAPVQQHTTAELQRHTQPQNYWLLGTSHTCECADTHLRPNKSDLILKVPKYYSAAVRMWLCLCLKMTFITNSVSRNRAVDFFFFFKVVSLIKLLKIWFRKTASWQTSVPKDTFRSSCLQ